MTMITLNGFQFAANDREFTESLFTPGGTCVGCYKPDGKGGYWLMDHQKNRIGGIRKDGLVFRASKRANGYWYQPVSPELIGGIDAPYKQTYDDAMAALKQL